MYCALYHLHVRYRRRPRKCGRSLVPANVGNPPIRRSWRPDRHPRVPASGRRGSCSPCPPTPPCVRRTRRFSLNAPVVATQRKGTQGQADPDGESGPPGSCGSRQHSTRDLDRSSRRSTPEPGPDLAGSGSSPGSGDASTAATEWHAASDVTAGPTAQT